MPSHIAIVTSPTGAAIRDVVTVMRRRFPDVGLITNPGNEGFARACNAGAAHEYLSAHAERHGLKPDIQQVKLKIGDAHAHGAVARLFKVVPRYGPVADMDAGFGNPIHVDQSGTLIAMALEPGP